MNELWIPILGVICAVGMPVLLGIIASYMTIKIPCVTVFL